MPAPHLFPRNRLKCNRPWPSLAWALAAWLGLAQPIADNYGGQAANLLASAVLLIASIADSVKGRTKVAG